MSEKDKTTAAVNRRQILKYSAYGACAFCLASVTGCVLFSDNEKEPPVDAVNGLEPGMTEKGLIKAKRSPWFSSLDDNAVRCELCPKSCKLSVGERGLCRVRENKDGEGYTLVYGNPALVQEDPVERKPFFHVMPGSRALSVSTAGCNLACKFCEVWDMALVSPEEVHAYDMPPEKIIEYALAGGVPSISYAFGEPAIFYEYMDAIADKAKENDLLNLVHTAGYIKPEPLLAIAKKLDAVNFDLKGFNAEFYREYVGGELETVLNSLKLLRDSGVHLEITNIVIPTVNDNMEEIGEMCSWIASELGPDVPLHFARFYPLYRLSALPRTPVSTLEKAHEKALEAGLKYVYIAKVTGHDAENTYCPNCGEKVVSRVGFVVEEISLKKGSCSFCETEMPGIWV